MNTTATADMTAIDKMSDEQKRQLLALLVKDELDRQPVPMPIIVRFEGQELGHFRPKITPPVRTTPYPFTPEEREELVRVARDPGSTLTSQELRALEASEDDVGH